MIVSYSWLSCHGHTDDGAPHLIQPEDLLNGTVLDYKNTTAHVNGNATVTLLEIEDNIERNISQVLI